MGFSLVFLRVQGGDVVDIDRAALVAWLADRGLTVEDTGDNARHLHYADGSGLAFDGWETDLHLNPLDQDEPLGGGIWHAHLSDEECAFIYEMCVVAKWLIVNPQGQPLWVVPGGTHEPDDLPDRPCEGTAWVNTPQELREALTGSFGGFSAFRHRVAGS